MTLAITYAEYIDHRTYSKLYYNTID